MDNSSEYVSEFTPEASCLMLLQSSIDIHESPIALLKHSEPIVLNRTFLKFCNVSTLKEFNREFGSLVNRFVPHDDYFHSGKVDEAERWLESLTALPQGERIVSMLDHKVEPYAFELIITHPMEGFSLITFKDVSQDLIKRILVENDATIDPESGAYRQDYFLHTLKSFQEAARFNRKQVGITMCEFRNDDFDPKLFADTIKRSIRHDDMLIRWNKKRFVLAYLIDMDQGTEPIDAKFRSKSPYPIRLASDVQNEIDDIRMFIRKVETSLNEV